MLLIQNKFAKIIFVAGVFFLLPLIVFAQQSKKSRVLFLLDASSSMTYNWSENYSRFDIASNILLRIVDSIYSLNPEVEFALRTYGATYPAIEKNCTDTRLEVPFNLQNINQINTRLKSISPVGYSPIAYSLKQASNNELNNASLYDYSIIFITDGGESCNGDVCATFQEFLKKKIKITPYIIGLDKNEQLNLLYDCMGNYLKVAEPQDIDIAIQTIVNANRPLLDKPKVLNISPTFSNTPAIKNETPKVKTPIKTNQNYKTLTRLYASAYQQFKQKWTLHGQTQNRPLGVAIFRYVFEEIKKEESTKPKPSTVLARIKNIPYPITPNKDKARVTGHFIVNNTQTVTIHFDSETPVKKTNQVLPRLVNIPYAGKRFKSDIKLAAKPQPFNKKTSAILKFDIESPLVRKSDIFKKIYPSNYKWKKEINLFSKPNPIVAKKAEKVVLKFESFEERKKNTLTFIQAQNYPKRVAYAIRIPQPKPAPTNLGTALFRYNTTPSVKPTPTPAPKPTTPTTPTKPTTLSQDVAAFTTTIENNNEKTEVAVFFEGKTGKKYPNATPEIIFKDLSAQGTNVSFIRKVNGGNPIPQSIKEGQYDVVVKGYNDLFVKNVTIVPNKLNKVIINVSEGTLSFAYMGNRSRPMEYKAVVNRRFSNAPDVLQNCTQKLPYEPGTYYVEINTLPASKFSIDMSFGALYELQIPEPGYLQITNKTPYGNIFIQYEHGDKFETFYNMKISGSLSTQKIEILPGRYKIIFPVNPQMPQMGTKTIDVRITSNQTNEVELQ